MENNQNIKDFLKHSSNYGENMKLNYLACVVISTLINILGIIMYIIQSNLNYLKFLYYKVVFCIICNFVILLGQVILIHRRNKIALVCVISSVLVMLTFVSHTFGLIIYNFNNKYIWVSYFTFSFFGLLKIYWIHKIHCFLAILLPEMMLIIYFTLMYFIEDQTGSLHLNYLFQNFVIIVLSLSNLGNSKNLIELENSKNYLISLAETINCGYIITQDDEITYTNPYLRNILNFISSFDKKVVFNNNILLPFMTDLEDMNSLIIMKDIDTNSNDLTIKRNSSEEIIFDFPSLNISSDNKNKSYNEKSKGLDNIYKKESKIEINRKKSLKEQITILRNNKHLFKNLTYLGKKKFFSEEKSNVLYLDIYIRIIECNNKIFMEILINDITKTILIPSIKEFIINSGKYLHDFKNPLICIDQEISEIKENIENSYDENLKLIMPEKINFIVDMSQYCLTLISTYELFSRNIFKKEVEKINIELIDMRKIIGSVEKIINAKLKKNNKLDSVKLEIIFKEGKDFLIYSDPIKIQQILINLLSNSEKFTLTGKITLEIFKTKKKNKDYLKVSIKDTGMGMDLKTKKNLFTPFFSMNKDKENPNGCGLGLIIVKELTKLIGLQLEVKSELGKGSEFLFYIQDKKKEYYNKIAFKSTENILETERRYRDSFEKFDNTNKKESSKTLIPNNQEVGCPISFKKNCNEQFSSFPALITENNCKVNSPEIVYEENKKLISSQIKLNILPASLNGESFTFLEQMRFNTVKEEIYEGTEEKKTCFYVMICDDDSYIIKSYRSLFNKISEKLNNLYIILEECSDGTECLYKIIEKTIKNQAYDLIIIDDEMKYLDGSEVFKIIDFLIKGNYGREKLVQSNLLNSLIICSANIDNLMNKINDKEFHKNIKSKPLNGTTLKTLIVDKLKKDSII